MSHFVASLTVQIPQQSSAPHLGRLLVQRGWGQSAFVPGANCFFLWFSCEEAPEHFRAYECRAVSMSRKDAVDQQIRNAATKRVPEECDGSSSALTHCAASHISFL
jgi:hypothetical protein